VTESQSSYLIRMISEFVIACSNTYRGSLSIKPLLYICCCIWLLNIITLTIIFLIVNERQDLLMVMLVLAMTLHVGTLGLFAYLVASQFIDRRRIESRIKSITSLINLVDRLRTSVLKSEN